MAYKPLWNFLDKSEGRKEGDSIKSMEKEKERQGYKKKHMANKMGRTATAEDRKKDPYLSADSKVWNK